MSNITIPTTAPAANVQYVVNRDDLETIFQKMLRETLNSMEAERKDTLIKKKEACKLLGVTEATLWRWEKAGYIKPRRLGSKVYYSQYELNNMKGGADL